MSGVEIAGLVLGAFPLLISAFEHYRDAAKAAGLLTSFESEYRKSFNDVKDEQLIFRLNAKLLLWPLVLESVLEADDLDSLMEDPGGQGWKSSEVEQALSTRLGQATERYIEIMQELQLGILKLLKTMGFEKPKFQARINAKKDGLSPEIPQNTRSKLVLRANKEYLRTSLEYRTQQIKFGLGRASRDETVEELRQSNKKLGKLLKRSDQVARLQESSTVAVSRKASKSLLQYWQHADRIFTLVQASWGCACSKTHCANLWLHHPSSTAQEFKMLLLWAPRNRDSADFPPWEQQGLQITWLQGEIMDGKINALAAGEVRGIPAALPVASNGDGVTRSTAKRVKFWEPAAHQSSTPPAGTVASASLPAKAGNKQTDTQLLDNTTKVDDEIRHLCRAVANCGMGASSLGALTDLDRGLQYSVFAQPEQKMFTTEISLRTVLRCQGRSQLKKRSDRFKISLAVASAHLQLHSTPWARRQWEARDILFPQDARNPDTIMFDKPYISADFDSSVPVSAKTPRQTDRSFAGLGIMLLELLFGVLLERHDIWQLPENQGLESNYLMRTGVACKWADDVADEAGEEYAAAVKWCLHESPATLDGSQWRRDLAERVVMPLQHCCDWIQPKSG